MRILLAIDDSKYSEAAVQALIGQFPPRGNEVHVLHVIEPLPSIYGGAQWGYVADWQAVTREQRKEAEELVALTAKTLRAAGFEITTAIEEGDPKTVILDCAAKWPADLVLMGPHGRKALERFLLGSVSEGVARHATCSVQIVRARNA
jgi:nucleotide-binding universal stress UspA family protein